MDAENLRIGNFVGIKEEIKKDVFDTCAVDDPKALAEDLFPIASIIKDEVNLYIGDEEIEFSCDELKEVEITDEILKRFGFIESNPQLLYLSIHKLNSEIHYEKKPYGNLFTLQSDIGTFIPYDIDYVHQLQNLFWGITGDELILFNENKKSLLNLLPCPFCGSNAEMLKREGIGGCNHNKIYYDVRCTNKKCYLQDGADWYCDNLEEVIQMWNKRK